MLLYKQLDIATFRDRDVSSTDEPPKSELHVRHNDNQMDGHQKHIMNSYPEQ